MSAMMSGDSWALSASCSGVGDSVLPEAVEQRRILELCPNCPVRLNCLAEALDERIPWGVWGGLTEHSRREVLRRRPDVSSWRKLLTASAGTASPRTR
jgi:WhiB family redox-sensing transcriptional regulator